MPPVSRPPSSPTGQLWALIIAMRNFGVSTVSSVPLQIDTAAGQFDLASPEVVLVIFMAFEKIELREAVLDGVPDGEHLAYLPGADGGVVRVVAAVVEVACPVLVKADDRGDVLTVQLEHADLQQPGPGQGADKLPEELLHVAGQEIGLVVAALGEHLEESVHQAGHGGRVA